MVEEKAPRHREVVRGRFDESEHPRDSHGRFITKGGSVRLPNGKVGKVTDTGPGKVTVETRDGSTTTVAAGTVENVSAGARDTTPAKTPAGPVPKLTVDQPAAAGRTPKLRVADKPGRPIAERLVDYKPDRSLSDPAKTRDLAEILPNTRYQDYGDVPFLDRMHELMGVDDPDTIPVADYVAARERLFSAQPVREVPLDKIVVTQETVNTDRVQQIIDRPETGGTNPGFFVRYGHETYVMNGHHRVASQVLSGDTTTSGRLLDLFDDAFEVRGADETGEPLEGFSGYAYSARPQQRHMGDWVRLDDGREGEVSRLYANGDIRVSGDNPDTGSFERIRVSPDRVTEVTFDNSPDREVPSGVEGLAGLPDDVRQELETAYGEFSARFTVGPAAVSASPEDWKGGDNFAIGGSRILFNPKIADPEWRRQHLGKGIAAQTMREALLHEWGHTLTRRLEMDDRDTAQGLFDRFTSEIQKANDDTTPLRQLEWGGPQNPTDRDFAGGWNVAADDPVGGLSLRLSGYAGENASEAISEALVRREHGYDNKYVDWVSDAFTRYERPAGDRDRMLAKVEGFHREPGPRTSSTPGGVDVDGVTEPVRAGDLQADDWVMMPGADNRLHAVAVNRVGVDDFGEFSIDYQFRDGVVETVALDESEVINRVRTDGGGTPDPEPVPEPERDVDELAVTAGQVGVGDRLAAEDGSFLVIANTRQRSTGLRQITSVDDRGRRRTMTVADSYGLLLASQASEPDPLPEGTDTRRPVLATYQRKTLAALDLETSTDPVLAQAAARVRARQELSLEQATALSAELRRQAQDSGGTRQRSLNRLSAQVGAVVTDLGGGFTPDQQRQSEMRRVGPGDITEGDQVAVAGRTGLPVMGKVVGRRAVLSGRLTELTVDTGDGSTETVMLSRNAPAFLLPDLPDPEPLPEPEDTGRVTRETVQPGDRLRIPYVGLDPVEGVVTAVEPEEGEDDDGNPVPGVSLTIATGDVTSGGQPIYVTHFLSGDDSVELVDRGGRDAVNEVVPSRSEAEDLWVGSNSARVQIELEHLTGNETFGGRTLSAMLATGPESLRDFAEQVLPARRDSILEIRHQDRNTIHSLVRGMAPAATPETQRALVGSVETLVRQSREEYLGRLQAAMVDWPEDPSYTPMGHLEQVLAATPGPDMSTVAEALTRSGFRISTADQPDRIEWTEPSEERRGQVDSAITAAIQMERERFGQELIDALENNSRAGSTASKIAKFGNQYGKLELSARGQQEILDAASFGYGADRIRSVPEGGAWSSMRTLRGRLLDGVLAKTHGRRDIRGVVAEVLREQAAERQPGTRSPDWHDALMIRSLAEMKLAAGGDAAAPEDTIPEPDLPEVPEGSLRDRVQAIRAVLPDGENIGKRRQKAYSFAPTTLADLQAGRVPDVVQAETFGEDIDRFDRGPGRSSLRHLAAVREAGKLVDARVQERIQELLAGRSDVGGEETGNSWELVRMVRNMGFEREFKDKDVRRRIAEENGFHLNDMEWSLKEGQRRLRQDKQWGIDPSPQVVERVEKLKTLKKQMDAAVKKELADFDKQLADVTAERDRVRALVDEVRYAGVRARSQAVLEALSEVREMGPAGPGQGVPFDKSRGKLLDSMRWAEQFYPRAWIDAARTRDRAEIELREVRRGYSSPSKNGKRVVALSKGTDQMGARDTTGIYRDVAVHELGHQMEDRIPGLVAAQRVFLFDRTSEGEVGGRAREGKNALAHIANADAHEVGRQDKFPKHYTGKEYRGGRNYEVFTTGIESLVAGSPYMEGDDDFRQFMLGVLALL